MSQVAIVTDSTAYLPPEYLDRYQIQVIPLQVIWDNETYRDGVDISPTEFYQRLTASDSLPSTSQPPAAKFHRVFQHLLDRGQDVLAVLISSEISGTVDSALQACRSLDQDRISIVDSRTAAMATGLHVLAAARAAEQGAELQECQEVAHQAQRHTDVVFAVNTLEFLHRGGRIGGAKRLLGSMLDIKPILEMRGGKIEPLDQVRTRRKAVARLIDILQERIGDESPVRVAAFHSHVPGLAADMLESAQNQIDIDETITAQLSPVIGTHVGPGTLALAAMHGM